MHMLRRTLGLLAAIVGRLVRGSLAAGLLGVLLVGVPWGLTHYIGWPLPDHLPPTPIYRDIWLHTNYDVLFVLRALAVLLWIFWARFALAVAVEIIDITAHMIRYGRRPKLPTGPVQITAAILAGALISLLCLDLIRGLARPATPATTAAPRADVAAVAQAHPGATTSPSVPTNGAKPPAFQPRGQLLTTTATTSGRAATATTISHATRAAGTVAEPEWVAQARAAGHPIYVVQPDDNLTTIAVEQLGDAQRWREIYVLNRGKPQPTGYTLSNPDEIDKTWFLALPLPPASPETATDATTPSVSDQARDQTPSAGPVAPATSSPATTSSPAPSASSVPADDGVASPPTARPTPATTPAPESASPIPATPNSAKHAATGLGVDLPSGAWLSGGLAAVLAGLATAVLLHRRRRARPRFPIPLRPEAAGLAPLPTVLRVVAAHPSTYHATAQRDPSEQVPPPLSAIVAATADDAPVSLLDLASRGAALAGPGAPAALRAIIAAALSAAPLEFSDLRSEIIIPSGLLEELLGGSDQHPVERLHLVDDLPAGLAKLEDQLVFRRGVFEDFGVESHAALKAVDECYEPMWLQVLIARAHPDQLARIAAVLTQAPPVRLGVILLGAADTLPSYTVASDGTLTPHHHTPAVRDAARLSTLSAADLADILAVLPEVAYEAASDHDGDPFGASPTAEPNPAARPAAHAAFGADTVTQPDGATSDDLTPPAVLANRNPAAPIRLNVLGVPTFTVHGQRLTRDVRSDSYAVAALVAANPDGLTIDEIIPVLECGADPEAAKVRLRVACMSLRKTLRQASGLKAKILLCDTTTHRYRFDPELVDVDVWRMQAAIHAANAATDDAEALAALRHVADAYGGTYATGIPGDLNLWREAFRRQAVDALTRIAELDETDHPDAALQALETALGHDPYNEALYQRIMIIQGRCGRPDAVRRTLGLLENRLYEIEAEPSSATLRLVRRQSTPAAAAR